MITLSLSPSEVNDVRLALNMAYCAASRIDANSARANAFIALDALIARQTAEHAAIGRGLDILAGAAHDQWMRSRREQLPDDVDPAPRFSD